MTRRGAALGPGLALITFWVASLSVGFAAFIALAFLSHRDDTGALAAASAVLGVSFVLAVVPGAIQLRAAAAAAAVDEATAAGSASSASAASIPGDRDAESARNGRDLRHDGFGTDDAGDLDAESTRNGRDTRHDVSTDRVDATDRVEAAGVPVGLVAWITGGLLVASPALGAALTVPWLAIALLVVQLPFACVAAVQRGTAIGRKEYGRASASMGADAAFRLVAGAGLGVAFGATGLAAGLLLGTVAAAGLGRRWYTRGVAAPASTGLGPALTVGILMVLINLDVLAAPRVLGAAAADAYAVAELPAKGVFFALFAVSWLAVPVAARARRRTELLVPIGAVLGLGLLATGILAVARPLLPIVLGGASAQAGDIGSSTGLIDSVASRAGAASSSGLVDSASTAAGTVVDAAPSLQLLVLLALAMTVAAALATALAMAVARDAAHPWAPALFATMMLGIVIVVLHPDATDLAGLVLLAQAVALAGTTLGLLRTIGARALPATGRPLAATP